MKSIILRAPNNSALSEQSGFKAVLDRVLPLIATLEEDRPRYSPDLRAEVLRELEVLADAIDGADELWPELRHPCQVALDAIHSLMTRLATPSLVAIKPVVAANRVAPIHNPFLTESICKRLQQCDREPILVEITEGETTEERARIGQIREVLKCDPTTGDIVARMILKPYDRVVCRGHQYEAPRSVNR